MPPVKQSPYISKKNSNTKDRLINELIAVTDALSSVSGHHMEIVLHDLEHPEASVLKIVNAHVSGWQVGSPIVEGPENDMGIIGLLAQEVSAEKTGPQRI